MAPKKMNAVVYPLDLDPESSSDIYGLRIGVFEVRPEQISPELTQEMLRTEDYPSRPPSWPIDPRDKKRERKKPPTQEQMDKLVGINKRIQTFVRNWIKPRLKEKAIRHCNRREIKLKRHDGNLYQLSSYQDIRNAWKHIAPEDTASVNKFWSAFHGDFNAEHQWNVKLSHDFMEHYRWAFTDAQKIDDQVTKFAGGAPKINTIAKMINSEKSIMVKSLLGLTTDHGMVFSNKLSKVEKEKLGGQRKKKGTPIIRVNSK